MIQCRTLLPGPSVLEDLAVPQWTVLRQRCANTPATHTHLRMSRVSVCLNSGVGLYLTRRASLAFTVEGQSRLQRSVQCVALVAVSVMSIERTLCLLVHAKVLSSDELAF